MKKLLCLLLGILMLLSFVACDSDDDDNRSSRRKKKESTSETGEAVATSGYKQAVEDMVDMYACRATKGANYYLIARHLGSVWWKANPEQGASYYIDVGTAYIAFLKQADMVNWRGVTNMMETIAEIYESIRDFDEAITMRSAIYEQACELYGEVFEETVDALKQLAMTYYKSGDLDAAYQLLEELYTHQCLIYEDKDPQPAVTMALLANICQRRDDHRQALDWLIKLHDNYSATYGTEDPCTLEILLMQAAAYRDLGMLQEAKTLGEKVYAAYRTICGEEHAGTIRARDFLRNLTDN